MRFVEFLKYYKKIVMIVIAIIVTIITVFVIKDLSYLNDVNFYLNGESSVTIFLNQQYNDDGYMATYKDSIITNKFLVKNNLNIKVSGDYNITYTIKKGIFHKTFSRLITVRQEDYNDLTFSLKGEEVLYLLKGKDYVEPGVIAVDRTLGDISKKITVVGTVNNNVTGVYKITYQVANAYGVVKNLERIVTVYDLTYTLKLETNEFVKDMVNVIFNTNDSKYAYTILPNNDVTPDKIFQYSIKQNGIYKFIIYDINKTAIEKEIEVNNIYKTPPTGTCTGIMYDNSTILKVDAISEVGIDYYTYHYGTNESKQKGNSFTYKEMINESSVDVYDKFGNQATFNCSMKDESTIIPSGYTSTSYYIESLKKTIRYWIYIPKDNHVREKVPLMIYLHGDGSKGTNINLVNNYAFPKFASEGQEYPFIMIAPQCALDANWTGIPERVKALIDKITFDYNIDTNRIIMSGGSSGGRGAYNMVATYPNFFSCLTVGSARIEVKYASKLTNIPIWAFHGINDSAVPYNDAKRLIDEINNLGGNAKLTTLNGGHSITEIVFKYPELIDWMVSQKKQ